MEKVSKTQKKAIALAAQDLGEKLVHLTEEQLAKIELPEKILAAIQEARKIRKHGGHKRQLQYIGALMRETDREPIREAVQRLEEGDRRQVELHKQIEHWRDELIRGNDGVVGEIAAVLPGLDQEQLRTLVAQARTELMKQNPSPTPSRVLFRFLHKAAQQAG